MGMGVRRRKRRQYRIDRVGQPSEGQYLRHTVLLSHGICDSCLRTGWFSIRQQIRPVSFAIKTAPFPVPFVVCSQLEKLHAGHHVKGSLPHSSRVRRRPSAITPPPHSADRPGATLPISPNPIALERQREHCHHNKHRNMPD